MNIQEFVKQYGKWIVSYKEYDNNVVRIKFTDKKRCMWLKGLVCEKMDMKIVTHSNVGPTYWFKPN